MIRTLETLATRFGWREACLIVPVLVSVLRIQDSYFRLPTYLLIFIGALLVLVEDRKVQRNVFIAATLMVILPVLHLAVLQLFSVGPGAQVGAYVFWAAKFELLLVAVAFVAMASEPARFLDTLVLACRLELLFALFFWSVSVFLGLDVGVDAKGAALTSRAQGFLSEPSYLSIVVPYFLLIAIRNNCWIDATLAAAVGILSFSPTVYLSVLLTSVCAALIFGPRWMRVLMLAGAGLITLGIYFADSLLDLLRDVDSSVAVAGTRLLEGVLFFSEGGSEVYANTRGVILFQLFELIGRFDMHFLGGGLGVGAQLADDYNFGVPLDVSIWASLLLWFGISGVLAFAGLLVFVAFRIRGDFEHSMVLIGLTVANSINGGGIYFQCLLFGYLLIALKLPKTSMLPAGHGQALKSATGHLEHRR